MKGRVNGLPLFPAGIGNGPRFLSRPLSRPSVMVVGPLKDLFFSEGWKLVDIAGAPVLGKQLGKRAIAGKVSESLAQGTIHALPTLKLREENLAAVLGRPFPRHFSVSIGPTKDLF